MASHPPMVRRFVPPTEEQRAEARAEAAQFRAEQDARREAALPARRAAILTGAPLRDVEAAVACHCSCHPRPADDDLHDGGLTCSCQLTPAERRAQWAQIFADFGDITEDSAIVSERAEAGRRFDETAAELGVEAQVEVHAAPFVIVGVCDGRGFFLRERHGRYRVTIAPDDDPGSDPWKAEPTATSIDIAAGTESELWCEGRFAPELALTIAVAAVRAALMRNACPHAAQPGPHCASCGVPLAEADMWRWS
jgi:hypothetical protein